MFETCGRFTDVGNSGLLLCGSQVWHLESDEVAQLPAASGNAVAINDLGQVVGAADGHAALWNPR